VGVAGSTSRSLAAACDELVTYDALPGISLPDEPAPAAEPAESGGTTRTRASRRGKRSATTVPDEAEAEADNEIEADAEDPQLVATRLLERALRLGQEKDDADWLHSSAVKSQMRRMDPSFSERALGYRSFSDFVKSRESVAELDDTSTARLVRLNPAMTAP
jgi:hypothetical protein